MLITTLRLWVIGSSLCSWNLPVSASAPEEVGVFIMADGGFGALWRGGGLVMPYDMTCTNAVKRLLVRNVEAVRRAWGRKKAELKPLPQSAMSRCSIASHHLQSREVREVT